MGPFRLDCWLPLLMLLVGRFCTCALSVEKKSVNALSLERLKYKKQQQQQQKQLPHYLCILQVVEVFFELWTKFHTC